MAPDKFPRCSKHPDRKHVYAGVLTGHLVTVGFRTGSLEALGVRTCYLVVVGIRTGLPVAATLRTRQLVFAGVLT